MKTRSVAAATIVALTFAVGLPAFNWAQDAAPEPNPNEIPEQEMARAHEMVVRAQEMAIRAKADAEKATHMAAEKAEIRIRQTFPGMKGFPRHLTQIQEAAEKLRDAKDESDKAAATKELTAVVDKFFKEDMRVREQELADIAARLDKLRVQLDRRRAKKQDIVDLQIKVAINEAEGLGFSSQPKNGGAFNFRFEAPVMVSPSGDVMVPPPPVPVAVPMNSETSDLVR
ncbi:MAG: hypothetical protein WD971_09730 [Pirellulales bacterium]